jgi:hypothetical protein
VLGWTRAGYGLADGSCKGTGFDLSSDIFMEKNICQIKSFKFLMLKPKANKSFLLQIKNLC